MQSCMYSINWKKYIICLIVSFYSQFVFVVLFSVFLWKCVDYDVLFYEKYYNGTHKVTLSEAVIDIDQCVDRWVPTQQPIVH